MSTTKPTARPARAAAKPATKSAKPAAGTPPTYTEKVTINGRNVVIAHHQPPVDNAGVLENGDIFRLINVFDEKFAPTNATRADGTPLRLFTSPRTKVDVSKRRKEDMSFWHRNIDAHEIIFCVKGALAWETELGNVTMKPGDMLFIPKGIAHRSRLAPESSDENVLIELKIADDLEYVGEDH
ncbi:cupin domain-containing protein [Xanthobacter sediminis]